METKKRIGIVSIATIVAPIIVIILVLGTIFTGRHASAGYRFFYRRIY